jgi:hypothetical protein
MQQSQKEMASKHQLFEDQIKVHTKTSNNNTNTNNNVNQRNQTLTVE